MIQKQVSYVSVYDPGHTHHLTDEAVQRTIEVVENEDKDSIPVITPEYQIAILKTAAQIREVPVWTLLKYISRKVKIS